MSVLVYCNKSEKRSELKQEVSTQNEEILLLNNEHYT
jgi:hypothetical protein